MLHFVMCTDVGSRELMPFVMIYAKCDCAEYLRYKLAVYLILCKKKNVYSVFSEK